MAFDFGSFVNAGQFSDPANYSGLGGQMPSVKEVAEKAALASLVGAAPPGGAAPEPRRLRAHPAARRC